MLRHELGELRRQLKPCWRLDRGRRRCWVCAWHASTRGVGAGVAGAGETGVLNVGTGIGCIGVLGGVDQVRALGELRLAGLLQGASYIMRTSCMHVAHDHNDNGLQSYILCA